MPTGYLTNYWKAGRPGKLSKQYPTPQLPLEPRDQSHTLLVLSSMRDMPERYHVLRAESTPRTSIICCMYRTYLIRQNFGGQKSRHKLEISALLPAEIKSDNPHKTLLKVVFTCPLVQCFIRDSMSCVRPTKFSVLEMAASSCCNVTVLHSST